MGRVSTPFGKVRKPTRVSQLLILISFLITFTLARFTVKLQQIGLPLPPIIYQGIHIHHLVPGIFLILVSGYLGISFWKNRNLRWLMAVLFGVGAALTLDELALLVHLKDVYFSKEGRLSIDAVIIIAVLFLIGFSLSQRHDHYEFKRFWRRFAREKIT